MAGGMMGGAAGTITTLDPTGQVLPDAESPLSALARADQDELDAALDAELEEQDRAEREAENQALRDYMDEEADFVRAKDMTVMEEERAQQLEAQRQSQIDEEFRRQSAREAADRGSLPGEPETIAQQQQREYEDELREIWDIDAEEERMQRLEALQREFDKGRLPHLRGLSLAERLTPKGQRQEETELFLAGTQLAEGEIVAGLPVETAGRATTTLGQAMEEAREKQKTRAAEEPLKPVPTVADRRKSKMGEPVVPDELVEPPKPEIPPTTKAFNPRRDNIIIAAAKTRGLDKDAWAAEGVDPNEFREPENAYGSKRAFRAGGMTPDEATEWAAELGFIPVDEHGKGEPHAALDAIMETLGGKPVYTLEGAQYGAELKTQRPRNAWRANLIEISSGPYCRAKRQATVLYGKNLSKAHHNPQKNRSRSNGPRASELSMKCCLTIPAWSKRLRKRSTISKTLSLPMAGNSTRQKGNIARAIV
jgi:hypothetical protein